MRAMNLLRLIGLAAFGFGLIHSASAEESGDLTLGKRSDVVSTIPDLSVPPSPAFTVLGATPQNATNPSTLSELKSTVLNGFDANGNFKTGLGFDTNPYLLFQGPNVTLGTYDDDFVQRALTNTQLSFATAQGVEEEDESLSVALGLHTTLYLDNEHDPRRNAEYLGCLGGSMKEIIHKLDPPNSPFDEISDEQIAKYAPEIRAAKASCLESHIDKFQNPSAWTIGVAPTLTSEDGSTDELEWSGASVWTTLSLRIPSFDNAGQLVLHARYRDGAMVPSSADDGTLIEQDEAMAAARLKIGRETWNTSVEGAYIYTDSESAGSDSYYQVTAGVEVRLSEGIWFEVSGGSNIGRDGEDDAFGLATVKWNLLGGLAGSL